MGQQKYTRQLQSGHLRLGWPCRRFTEKKSTFAVAYLASELQKPKLRRLPTGSQWADCGLAGFR